MLPVKFLLENLVLCADQQTMCVFFCMLAFIKIQIKNSYTNEMDVLTCKHKHLAHFLHLKLKPGCSFCIFNSNYVSQEPNDSQKYLLSLLPENEVWL